MILCVRHLVLMSGVENKMFKKKPVKIILSDAPNHVAPEAFEVKRVTNTLKVKVGEYVDEELVRRWIKDNDNWTIEFVK